MGEVVGLPGAPGISKAQIEALRAKHGRVRYVEGEGWAVVLAMPTVAALKAYKHELHDPTMRPDAQENLFRQMAVQCWTEAGGSDVDALLAYAPLAPEGAGDAIQAMTGLKASERVKA